MMYHGYQIYILCWQGRHSTPNPQNTSQRDQRVGSLKYLDGGRHRMLLSNIILFHIRFTADEFDLSLGFWRVSIYHLSGRRVYVFPLFRISWCLGREHEGRDGVKSYDSYLS
eukprot:sb/3477041/